MNRRIFAASVACGLALPRVGESAGPVYAPDVPGKWRGWGENDDAYANTFAPDRAEQQRFFANARHLAEPLRKHPAYANPVGYEVAPYCGIRGDSRDKSPRPIPGHLTLQTFFYYQRNGKVVPGGESSCSLRILINSLRTILGPKLVEDEADVLCFAPTTRDNTIGVYGRWSTGWVLSKRTAPAFVPATQERVLKAWIYETRKQVRRNTPDQWQRKALDDYENALAKLSVAARESPAFVSQNDPKRLAPEGAPDAKAIVNANPNFYDSSLPRTALQVLCFPGIAENFEGANEPPVKALRQLIYRKMNYRALEALLS
jgi:hypothetical protein